MCSAETPSWQGLGLGEPCCVDILRGGRNSRVFGLTLDHGNRAAVKQYFRHPGDPRDRMGTEAAALRLMHGAGLACVPGLLGQDPEQGLTCLEFIDGTPSGPARPSDMDQAADLLLRLKDLAKSAQPGSAAMGLGPASEAFFSADDVVQNLRQRLARLEAAPQDAPLARELQDFLRGSLAPALERSVDRCASQLAPRTMQTVLPQDERTLSPSDFGLHNALRRADGLDESALGAILDFTGQAARTRPEVYVNLRLWTTHSTPWPSGASPPPWAGTSRPCRAGARASVSRGASTCTWTRSSPGPGT